MYLSHFQLKLKPFQVNSDKRFLYLSEKHEEALAILRYGILDNRGILVLTGDVGTGKTLLIHALAETLGSDVRTAIITDPSLKGIDFFQFVAHAFGMKDPSTTKGDFLIHFSDFLVSLSQANQRALLILDEAQCMEPDQLEEIRILSDIEHGHDRLLNIFFVGQNEFDLTISHERLRALKQRITTHYHLAPLTLEESGHYVQYRLKVAGCDRPLFTPSALEKIFALTKGYPRLINIICDHCLLTTFVKRLHQVDPAIVEESAADLMHPSQLYKANFSPVENAPRPSIAPPADIQPAAAPKTSPVVVKQTATQLDSPKRPTPVISFLQTISRQPAYLIVAAILLPALIWINFRDDLDPNRQATRPSPELREEIQTKADMKPLQSSTLNSPLGASQREPEQPLSPTVLATPTPTEKQLLNTTAALADQSAPPPEVSPTVQPDAIAAPPKDSVLEPPTAMPPSEGAYPIDTDPTTLENATTENLEPPSTALKPDQIAVPREKPEAADIVPHDSPQPTLPAASEADASSLLSEKKDAKEMTAAPVTSPPPETATTPEEAPAEIKPEQSTPSDLIDGPAPSTSPLEASTVVVDEPSREQTVAPRQPAPTLAEPSSENKDDKEMGAAPATSPPTDLVDIPSPSTSPLEASTDVVDEPSRERAVAPRQPVPTLAEPSSDKLEIEDPEIDPRAIIDFVIQKRSRQSSEP
jgi:general secretion pathway protein A